MIYYRKIYLKHISNFSSVFIALCKLSYLSFSFFIPTKSHPLLQNIKCECCFSFNLAKADEVDMNNNLFFLSSLKKELFSINLFQQHASVDFRLLQVSKKHVGFARNLPGEFLSNWLKLLWRVENEMSKFFFLLQCRMSKWESINYNCTFWTEAELHLEGKLFSGLSLKLYKILFTFDVHCNG